MGLVGVKTGLAFPPGPLMVPVFAIGAGKVDRAGRRRASSRRRLPSFSAADARLGRRRIGLEPHYLTAMLPGALLVGIGVGLDAADADRTAATALPPQRFATGSAVLTMARQVGFTLGVAILVAVLGRPATPRRRLDAFRHGWEVVACDRAPRCSGSIACSRPAPIAVPAACALALPDDERDLLARVDVPPGVGR